MTDTRSPEPGLGTPTAGAPASASTVIWWLPVAVGIAGFGVLVAALAVGHGLDATTITGLPDPGRFTDWALPVTRVLLDTLATVTVGLAVTAAFLLPGDGRKISPQAYRMIRRGCVCALGWALASACLLVLTVSDILGVPLSGLGGHEVRSFATSVSQGQALALQAGMALLVAVLLGVGMSRTTAACAAVLAVIAVLPPAFTGHAAGQGNHQIAITSLALHVGAAALWAGGLVAVLTLRRSRHLAPVAARYSRMALGCFVVVMVSGAANAWIRVGTVDQLFRSTYGWLVLGKVVALLLLGGLGAVHRRRTLPALSDGRPGAFVRLATGEIVVFAATFGLAVALSRSPTPAGLASGNEDPLVDVLGFGMPAAPTAARMILDVLPDMFFLSVTVVGIGAYLAGVARMRRAGNRWPVARTASWVAGMLVLGAVTDLGVARYAYVLFSVHMAQHMVLSMLVPILLVGGAPITLALRTLRRPSDPSVRGPREWLLLVLHSRPVRVLTHPLVALGIYVSSLYGLYLSDALGPLMRDHLGHILMLSHFVLSGYLLFWSIIGIDPGRHRLSPPVRMLVHFATMIFHAFFGIILLQSTTVIAPDWYSSVHPPWAGSLLADQHLGAGIAWSFGEIPAAIVFILMVRQWIRDDEREQARVDRAAARADAGGEEDALARYNAFLARARDGS
jgi:cytochrome c oxidase assembly factor CtaG/putative copper export protein